MIVTTATALEEARVKWLRSLLERCVPGASLREIPEAEQDVIIAGLLHAANVLRSGREPWLVIDPKPFLGDPADDATQHLLNCKERLLAQPDRTIKKFAELLDVNAERVGLWTFARAAVASVAVDGIQEDWSMQLARALRATISPLK